MSEKVTAVGRNYVIYGFSC